MYNAEIRWKISEDDCKYLADNLRPEEVAEVYASAGSTPEEAVFNSVNRSWDRFATWQGDKLLCISGVCRTSVISNRGIPWLLTTPDLKKNPRCLIHYSKLAIQSWLLEFKSLINVVDARYKDSLNWARHVGFTVSEEAEPFGPFGMPFHVIEIRN